MVVTGRADQVSSSVTVNIPVSLRRFTKQEESVEVSGATVDAILSQLTEQFPALHEQIFATNGSLRRYVNIFVNDMDIRAGSGPETTVGSGDTITILPAIAGG